MDDADPPRIDIELADETQTAELAGRIAGVCGVGDVIALRGDLGAGKTVFARAFIRAYLGRPEEVPSPTFTLLQSYGDEGSTLVHHFDLYRLNDASETFELGFDEAVADGVTLIEWPDRLGDLLPSNRLDFELRQGPTADSRRARLIGHGFWRARLIESLGAAAIHG